MQDWKVVAGTILTGLLTVGLLKRVLLIFLKRLSSKTKTTLDDEITAAAEAEWKQD